MRAVSRVVAFLRFSAPFRAKERLLVAVKYSYDLRDAPCVALTATRLKREISKQAPK